MYSNHLHDGDGRQVKFEQRLENPYYSGGYEVVTRYRIFSSVTGKLLTEIDAAGQKIETHVSALDGEYRQMKAYSIITSGTPFNYPEQIVSEYGDPKGTRAHQWDRQTNTYKDVHMSPVGVTNAAIDWQQVKDRFTGAIGAQISYAESKAHYPGTQVNLEDPTNPGTGCELDGKSVSCAKLIRVERNGGIDEDSIRFYHGSGAIQGPGYGGGFGWDSDGVNEEGGLIVGGDFNGDLIIKNEATVAINTFLERSPGCKEKLEKLLLDSLKEAKYFDIATSKNENGVLDKSLYDLGLRASTPEGNKAFQNRTPRGDAPAIYGLAIGNLVFIGKLSDSEPFQRAFTFVHETLIHVAIKSEFGDLSHIKSAMTLGLGEYLKKGEKGNILTPDSEASYLIEDYILQDCKPDFKRGFSAGEKGLLTESEKRFKYLFGK